MSGATHKSFLFLVARTSNVAPTPFVGTQHRALVVFVLPINNLHMYSKNVVDIPKFSEYLLPVLYKLYILGKSIFIYYLVDTSITE